MTIHVPSAFGIVLRKNSRTAGWVAGRGFPGPWTSEVLNEDDHLIGRSVAWSGEHLERVMHELKNLGCVQGIDFVATLSRDGVLGPMPPWLSL